MSKPSEQISRIQQLEEVEKNVAKVMELIASLLNEVAKDKPVSKTVEANSGQITKNLEGIECGLMSQINYLISVSTSQPHAGSSYGAQKDLQLAHLRNETVKQQLIELEKTLANYAQ